MNILYLHQYFKSPSEPGGTRSYWIAKELMKAGHQVTFITSSSKISHNKERKKIDNIEVVYLKVPYDQKMNIAQRISSFFNFMLKSTIAAWKLKNIDLVIATSTPLTIGFPALMLKWFKRIPYVFEVRDLWPEVPIQMKGMTNPLLIKIARWFERTIYKNAAHIIALSPGMKDGVVAAGIPEQKVSMIPNMAKIEEFWPRAKNEVMMEELGLQRDSFKLIHFGSLGKANGAQYIIEAAKLLKEDPQYEFVFIGGGSTELVLKELCRKYQLSKVHFLGRFPMKQTSEIVNFCDVSIVSFLDLPILYTNSPNKLFDSLSAGKPIIVNSAGWTKELVEQYQCGYYVSPSAPEDLAKKINYLSEHLSVVKSMAIASRELAEKQYDKSILCKEFVSVVHRNLKVNN